MASARVAELWKQARAAQVDWKSITVAIITIILAVKLVYLTLDKTHEVEWAHIKLDPPINSSNMKNLTPQKT